MNYRKIDNMIGCNLDDVVHELYRYKEKGERVYIDFNGITLYSTTIDLNDAYLLVTGKTKEQYDKILEEKQNERKRDEEKHKAKIPELTKKWIEKGHEILDKQYWSKWDKIVPIRLNDLYHGMELKCCLDIIQMLNKKESYKNCKHELEEQNHSGMSYSLVSKMIYEFCDDGKNFNDYLDKI